MADILDLKSFKNQIPNDVNLCIDKLMSSGFEVFIVGGAIRNYLLNRDVSDYDLCTNANPSDILEVFKDFKTIKIGMEFGTVMVIMDKNQIEITSYRIEKGYIDGRRPSDVVFSNSLRDDLKRRDFTINALAYNPYSGLVDEFDGLRDLKMGIIRAVGDPDSRLSEDYLRILRAIRLATELDFELDIKLSSSINTHREGLKKISKERIAQELIRILMSETPSKGFRMMASTGVLRVISIDIDRMVGFNQESSFHDYDLFEHSIRVMDNTEPILSLRLAAILHDIGKPETKHIDETGEGRYFGHQNISAELAENFLREYRFSNQTTDLVVKLVQRHMDCVNEYTPKSVKKLISRMGKDVYKLFDLQIADILSTNHEDGIKNVLNGRKLADSIISEEKPVDERGLAIDGRDLLAIGYEQGKKIGETLRILTDMVLEDDNLNKKEILIEKAKNLL